jgi:hypothetical protein
MRFLSIVKAKEGGPPPSPEAFERIGKLMEEGFKAGWLLSAEGLMPSEHGFRVRSTDGKVSVMDGPFTESKEIVGGFSIFKAASKEEAIELTKKFAAAGGAGDAETEVRQLYDMPAA